MFSLKLRPYGLLLASTLVLVTAGDALARERIQRVFKVAASPSVTVRNISGSIEVRTSRNPEVQIVAEKSSEYMDVEIEQVGNSVRVQVKMPHQSHGVFGGRGSVDIFVTMPEEGNLQVNSISGDIFVEDLRGDLQLETVSGDLELRRLGKRLWAKSVSGDINFLQGQLDLDISTVSGDVSISEADGRVDARSVSGSVRLSRVNSPRVSLSTTSGDVEMDIALTRGGSYNISSHSGYVGLYLARDASFELSARTFSGELESDIELSLSAPSGERRRRGRSIRATHGSGDASIDVQTFSGDIRIIRR